MELHKLMRKTERYMKKNSNTILSIIAGVGVIITTATTVQATVKVMHILPEDMPKQEKYLKVAKECAIPTLFCISTLGCIFGANVLSRKQQASMASAYAMLNTSYKDYRKALIELHGEEADIEVRRHMARMHCDFHEIEWDEPDDEKLTFYDEITGQTFKAYEREVMDAEYHINRNYVLRGDVSVNEYLEFMNLFPMEGGDEIGWSVYQNEMYWIDFEHDLIEQEDGTFFYRIVPLMQPEQYSEEYY